MEGERRVEGVEGVKGRDLPVPIPSSPPVAAAITHILWMALVQCLVAVPLWQCRPVRGPVAIESDIVGVPPA